MKLSKTSIALATIAGALMISPGFAQETKPPAAATPPAQGQAPAGGQRGGSVENRLMQLSEQLKLTEEQKPKVKAVLEAQFKKMQAVPQEERRAKVPAIREEANKQLKEILTPEQFKQYEEIQQQQRAQRRGQGQGGPANPEKPANPAAAPEKPANPEPAKK
jgi:Spy/CpxP family protein refolding chaperone